MTAAGTVVVLGDGFEAVGVMVVAVLDCLLRGSSKDTSDP